MELITEEIEATLPPLYSQENVPDPVAVAKFFDPCGRYTLYVLEGRREPDGDLLLFGFCRSPLGEDCDELGYVTLSQLESVRGPLGLGIERDLYLSLRRSPRSEENPERKEIIKMGELIHDRRAQREPLVRRHEA